MANGGAVISQLFPQARITSTYRAPGTALATANPRSWHTNSHAAVDVAPVRGMTYGQYIQRIQDAGYRVIESRDEEAHPLPWTTGPNWHVVIGQ